jgi:hypothetical protein
MDQSTDSDKLEEVEACAYYVPVLLKVAFDFAHLEKKAPDLVVQLARLWLAVLVRQKGADEELAKQKIARSIMIPLASFQVGAAHFKEMVG